MPCCIDLCPPGEFPLVKFPLNLIIRKRWLAAIKAGTGSIPAVPGGLRDPPNKGTRNAPRFAVKSEKGKIATTATAAVAAPQNLEICLGHFPDPGYPGYQDPTVFINSDGKRVNLACCRLCHRFETTAKMYPLDGKISGLYLNCAILKTMKIRLKQDEDPRFVSICHSCLVKVDLVMKIQNNYLMLEASHGCFLIQQAPLELVEPVGNGMVIGEEDVTVKEEVVHVETTVKDEELDADRSDGVIKSNKQPVDVEEDNGKRKVAETDPAEPQKERVKKPKRQLGPRGKYKKKHPKQPPPTKAIWLRTLAAKTCYICSTVLEDKEHQLAHLIEEHAGKIEYKCSHCPGGKQLKTVEQYNSHLSLHDATARPLQCHFCTLRYSTRKGLEVHETNVHGAPSKHRIHKTRVREIICEECGKTFSKTSLHREHILVVHQQGGIATQCKICLKVLTHRSNLTRHMLMHTGEHPHKCDQCGQQFKIVTDLNKHVLSDHEGKMSYYCNKCDIPLKDKNAYYRHRNQHKFKGPAKRSLKCGLCSILCESLSELKHHIGERHPNQDYPYMVCPLCPSKFISPTQLALHKYNKHCDKRSSRATKLLCSECGEQQQTQGHLDTHMTKVHGAEKRYACQLCNGRFSNHANLSRHQRLHQGLKRFACDFCAKTFHQKGAMENHRRCVHTGEKAFECAVCGKGFKETSTYYRHKAKCTEKLEAE